MEKPRAVSERYVKIALWVAQGFGIGRIPFAPGTFGSVLGILWLAALLALKRPEFVLLGAFALAALSVWLSGFAEQTLGKKDPGSVVIDEICAIPFCFIAWLLLGSGTSASDLHPMLLFENGHWKATLIIFVLFRIADISKPWPANISQKLPGGWGVTVDDLIAAVWVNIPVLIYYKLF
jgi:phosphatidylglycerophosphatase A